MQGTEYRGTRGSLPLCAWLPLPTSLGMSSLSNVRQMCIGRNLLRSLISRPGLLWVQMSCTPVCHSLPLPPGRVTGDFLDSQTAVQACPELCHLPAIHRAYVAGSCAQSQPEELSDPVPFRGVRKQPRVQPELEQGHRRTRSLRGSIGWTRFSWPPEETDAGRASSEMRERGREGT